MTDFDLGALVLLWLIGACCYFFVYTRLTQGSCGLTLAYLLGLFVNHWFGAAIYLMPAHTGGNQAATASGFLEASIGLAGFFVGSLALSGINPRPGGGAPTGVAPWAYVAWGLIAYFLLLPFTRYVPSSAAVLSSGLYFVAAGLTLGSWLAWRAESRPLLLRWVLGAAVLPVLTVLVGGFLGAGAAVLATLAVSIASFYRPRWHVVVGAFFLSYLGLSIFVTYLGTRSDIRGAVWGGERLPVRLSVLGQAFASFRPFDPTDPDKLTLIDIRMNQNYLVGAAVEYLAAGGTSFAGGATIRDAVLAIVPRAVWPDKPFAAGSGDLVSDYTGIGFAEATSVGIGTVLEMYINFGSLGVFVGFAGLGALVTFFDFLAAGRLRLDDDAGFVRWYVPGLALQQVGGSLVEVTAGVGGAFVAVFLVDTGLRALAKRVS